MSAEEIILSRERAALERWAHGDPSGFLDITDPDITYFDPFLKLRLDGIDRLSELYEKIRGMVRLDHWELVNPAVQMGKDMAVLTFNFLSRSGEQEYRWNCTEIYRRTGDGDWRILHTHWSLTETGGQAV